MLGGSRAFFDGLVGFSPHDTDVMCFVRGQKSFLRMYNEGGVSVFSWRDDAEVVEYILTQSIPIYVAALLVPEFAEHFGVGVDIWERARSLAEKLDERHRYLGLILDFYITNGAAKLTDEQRLAAYEAYKKARPEIYGKK